MTFKKGYIPWIKGKNKKDYPQLSNSGRKKGCITWNKNLPSELQPFYGKKQTDFQKRRVSEANKNKDHSGRKNTNWKDGAYFNIVEKIKKIKRKSKYICQICKKNIEPKNFFAHHIDYNRRNNNIKNLICVCRGCHKRIHTYGDKFKWA